MNLVEPDPATAGSAGRVLAEQQLGPTTKRKLLLAML
jgi:hypothetical protein